VIAGPVQVKSGEPLPAWLTQVLRNYDLTTASGKKLQIQAVKVTMVLRAIEIFPRLGDSIILPQGWKGYIVVSGGGSSIFPAETEKFEAKCRPAPKGEVEFADSGVEAALVMEASDSEDENG
jgi:hypothetical protein